MKLSPFSLAVTIAGAFIGAGFVSGQELWQFFGAYGIGGIAGFTVAILCIIALSSITIQYASKTGSNTFERIINPSGNKLLKKLLLIFQTVFYISIYIIMTAGVESLVSEYCDVSPIITGIVFCITVTVISLIGIDGIVVAFSATIPILICAVIAVAFFVLPSNEIIIQSNIESSPSLVSNWLVSSLVFVSYNFFAGLGIFASLQNRVKGKKILIKASVLATTFLLVLGLSILLSIFATDTHSSEMPMLSVSKSLNGTIGLIYAILLVIAMLGAGISSLFPLTEWFKVTFPKMRIQRIVLAFAVSAITVTLSLFGFSNLIGTVYPIFGYVGFLIIAIIIRNCIKNKT